MKLRIRFRVGTRKYRATRLLVVEPGGMIRCDGQPLLRAAEKAVLLAEPESTSGDAYSEIFVEVEE